MDIVEGVHKEVRVYLISEILQLLLQILFLQLLKLTLVATTAIVVLDAKVGAKHQ